MSPNGSHRPNELGGGDSLSPVATSCRKLRPDGAIPGNVNYCSLRVGAGQCTVTRNDDMEALGYVILESLGGGRLPWEGEEGDGETHGKKFECVVGSGEVFDNIESSGDGELMREYFEVLGVLEVGSGSKTGAKKKKAKKVGGGGEGGKYGEKPDYDKLREIVGKLSGSSGKSKSKTKSPKKSTAAVIVKSPKKKTAEKEKKKVAVVIESSEEEEEEEEEEEQLPMITFEVVTSGAKEKEGKVLSFPTDGTTIVIGKNGDEASGGGGGSGSKRRRGAISGSGVNLDVSWDKEVSMKHCSLKIKGGAKTTTKKQKKVRTTPISAQCEDLRSTNGTFVNGKKMGDRKLQVFVGDRVRVGGTVFLIGQSI